MRNYKKKKSLYRNAYPLITQQPGLYNIEQDAARVIEGFTGIQMNHEEKEGFNMCKAWEDHRKLCMREGELRKIIEISIKQLCRSINAAETAAMLEENEALIQHIYSAAEMYAPDYDVDKIYAELQKEEVSA